MRVFSPNQALRALLVTGVLFLTGCLASGSGGAPESPSTAEAVNSPPQISGNPATEVIVGSSYAFTPTASDPDGDQLTFSISNRPSWASFNSTTGALSGTPGSGSEGNYENIVISVSDGAASASLSAFSIQVVSAGNSSVTLYLVAPSTNADGSPLTDLQGYNIYYGSVSGSYSSQAYVGNPGISTYVVENLLPQTYYFVATAINSSGVESAFSNEIARLAN